MKFNFFTSVAFSLLFATRIFAQDLNHFSPDQKIRADIWLADEIKMNVYLNDRLIVSELKMALELEGKEIRYINYATEADQLTISTSDPVPVKFSNSTTTYNRLLVSFGLHAQWELVIGNRGLAYRWVTTMDEQNKVNDELLSFKLSGKDLTWFPKEETMISHYERMYLKTTIDSIKSDDFCSLPVLFQKEGGVNLFFSEADLFDYPNLFLRKANDNEQFKAIFPHVVLSIDIKDSDRNERITSEAEYIALTSGNRTFPWRIFALAEKDADLVNNNMIYELSSPLKIAAADWIKPGKVAWDWWNDSNIYGVDFQSGINNETYKYYIDFAAKFGLDYIILDEGWSKTTTDIMNCQPQINVPELVEYGKPKNVGVILWTLWKPLDSNMDSVLNLYEKWGVKGIKVDFMQRADQYMVNFYERVAGEAASRHLLVDFHGAFKPTGMQKAYPNIVNYEGLKGMENTKWSRLITPEHNLTLPFTRMVAGPMDYTPGAMDNAHEKYFSIRWSRPMSMGTRCHQVAMYVVYEAPLQMLADNPSNYYKEEETTAFIAQIPTTWDTTIVLDARIGEWILLARKKADKWFIGGMTVREKTFNMDLSFLPKGVYEVEFMQDGINSDKNAEDYKHGKITITAPAKIQVNIHHGGGYAAIITKKKPE